MYACTHLEVVEFTRTSALFSFNVAMTIHLRPHRLCSIGPYKLTEKTPQEGWEISLKETLF